MPWPCAVVLDVHRYEARPSLQRCYGLEPWNLGGCGPFVVAVNVKFHGARPWHLRSMGTLCCSREREVPRREAVASITFTRFSLGFSACHGWVRPTMMTRPHLRAH